MVMHGATPVDMPINASICDVVAHPKQYEGKLIRVKGWIESDGIENTTIVDRMCESKGFAVGNTTTAFEQSGIPELQRAIFSGSPGTRSKEIRATIVGVVHQRSEEGPFRTIIPVKVSDITVQNVK